MCGICGIVTPGAPPDVELLRPDARTAAAPRPRRQRLRTATGTRRWATRRLAIIDPEGGAQPLCNEDGTVWVTFNGEIFNYVELGEELRRRGHTFRTLSDTEVIVHAWEEWGEDCFSRFNGQWALALWDRREERLVLCRDRMGVRPLFYARSGRRLRVRLRGEGAVRRPDAATGPSTRPASSRPSPTGRRSPRARCSAASSSSSPVTSRSSTATGSARRRTGASRSPSRVASPARTSRRTPRSCGSGSSRRPGCGSCAATCRSAPTSPAASTPR